MIIKPVLVAPEYDTFRFMQYSVHVISNCIFNRIKCIPIIADYGIRLEIYTRHSKKYIFILVHH